MEERDGLVGNRMFRRDYIIGRQFDAYTGPSAKLEEHEAQLSSSAAEV